MVDGSKTAYWEVEWLYCLRVLANYIWAPVHSLGVPSPLPFMHGIAVQSWEFRNLLMHYWVRFIPKISTLNGQQFLWNNVPVVRHGGEMTLLDNDRRIKDGVSLYFAVYQHQIVAWKHWHSQYHTSFEGHNTTVSPLYGPKSNTSHCAPSTVKWYRLGSWIDMPLSHWPYVAVEKYGSQ